jgi:4-carboxymuconolactone decarboxylase
MKRSIGSFAIAATALLTVLGLLGASATFAQNDRLPKDVNRQSRNRLPLLNPDNASARARQIYDRGMANFAGVAPKGPSMRLHGTPEGALDLQMLSPLGLDVMQIPVLVTGRELDQPYEWSLHEMQALAVSLDPAVINIIRRNLPVGTLGATALGAREAVIIQLGREIYRDHKLSSDTYARALRLLGERNLVDVVSEMADYASVSASLSAFNQQMPPGFKQFLPLPFTPPDDIHPDSRNRLPLLPEPTIRPGVLYSRPLGGSPAGTGPLQIGLHGGGLKSLETSVPRRDIDVAILVTAREHDSPYDWTVNELAAVKDGLEPRVIDVIRGREPTAGLSEKDSSLIEFGRELFDKHYVTAATYARAVKIFGERNLVGLVSVMGQHTGEEVLLSAFDQQLPEGQAPLCCASGKGATAKIGRR